MSGPDRLSTRLQGRGLSLVGRRFTPSAWQVVVLEAAAAAAAYTLALLLRFVDEGAIPPAYATRAVPWAAIAALVHVATGQLSERLRRPRSPLARRPVAPFVVAGGVALLAILAINYALSLVDIRMPAFVAVLGPLLASAAGAALHLAATRHEVAAEELLPRPLVQLDVEACAPVLRGRRVLVTGAAGSIGSELARQVLAVDPAALVLLDINETGLFELEGELRAHLEGRNGPRRADGTRPDSFASAATPRDGRRDATIAAVMGDVADEQAMRELLARERPDVVFHAAAYKHVPLVEANPAQGFATNVLGTLAVCRAAVAAGTERVVVISTDKAVNPSSFMGLTKRVAELIVAAIGERSPGTLISCVRFGNVLGSRGSVVPTLLRQIDAGGPLTITHPDVQRYFMTISEAASLVLRTAAAGAPGALFVLDMGEELRIVELAERLVRLKGLRPGRDVPFVFTGLRPGEKLREELAGEHELLEPTDHPHVRRVVASYAVAGDALLAGIADLETRRRAGALPADAFPAALRALVDTSVRPAALV